MTPATQQSYANRVMLRYLEIITEAGIKYHPDPDANTIWLVDYADVTKLPALWEQAQAEVRV